MDVAGKVAIISGGASGLGEGAARRLVAHGANVVLFDLNETRGIALSQELGDTAAFFKTDITSSEQVQAAVDFTVKKFSKIDVIINCAGIASAMKICSKKGPHDYDYFRKVVDVNLIGPFNVMRLALVTMLNNDLNDEGGKGVIVNTASIAAYEGQIGQVAYSASKGGLVALTLPAARDLAADGIRVCAITPGIFETPMLLELSDKVRDSLAKTTPFPSRLGTPDEFAKLVQQIIENPMINGETIRIDGAIRMSYK